MTGHGTEDLEHEIEKSWTANAAAWADVVRQDLIASRRIGTNRAVFDAILERQPRRVLDVGCGEGWLAHQLAGNGIDVVGFDSSDALLEHARAGAGTFHRLSYDAFASNPAQTGHGFDVAAGAGRRARHPDDSSLHGCAAIALRRWLETRGFQRHASHLQRLDALVLPHDEYVDRRRCGRGVRC